MKEEELKKIIQKSTLETSDDFINKLMHTIDAKEEERKVFLWNSFRPVLITSSILLVVITFIFYKLLQVQSSFLEILSSIPKTPLFVLVTMFLLYILNWSIRTYERMKSH